MFPDKIAPELAEICGIHVGDGYLRNDGTHVELDISGHIREDKDYYNTHVGPLFSKVFEVDLFLKEFMARGTYGFVTGKRKIVRYFHDFLGFPYGRKARTVRVPHLVVQSADKEIYKSFIRGLFDTDGCLTFQKRYGTCAQFKRFHNIYPRIILSTVSEGLALDVSKMLRFLSIHHRVQTSKPSNERWSRVFRIWIYGENALKEWMEKIGFKNPVQITRYKLWKKLGHCPPNTTLDERMKMLKGM